MEILSNMPNIGATNGPSTLKVDFSQKISSDDVKEIKTQIASQAQDMMLKSIGLQTDATTILGSENQFDKNYEEFQSFLKDIGYESGKSISELSQEEAQELVSEDGLFGIKQTAQRISDFVIKGANGDEDLLRAGREGMIEGFKQAEEMWGEELPEISQETMKEAIKTVDLAMSDLGFSIVDKQV